MARSSDKTKERIVRAAEQLFAQDGYEAVSLRRITAKGKANIAAVNYHFRTKEMLLEKVMERQLLPIFQLRLKQLQALVDGGESAVVDVIRCYTQPIMDQSAASGLKPLLFGKLVGRLMDDHHADMPAGLQVVQQTFQAQWLAELAKRLEGVTRKDLLWRVHIFYGAVSYSLKEGNRVVFIDEKVGEEPELVEKLEHLVALGAAVVGAGDGAQAPSRGIAKKAAKKVTTKVAKKSARKAAKKTVRKVAKKKSKKMVPAKKAAKSKKEGDQVEFLF